MRVTAIAKVAFTCEDRVSERRPTLTCANGMLNGMDALSLP